MSLGAAVGKDVGRCVGALVGKEVGRCVGALVGVLVGASEGFFVGTHVGKVLGKEVGALLGARVGILLEGLLVGDLVRTLFCAVTTRVHASTQSSTALTSSSLDTARGRTIAAAARRLRVGCLPAQQLAAA